MAKAKTAVEFRHNALKANKERQLKFANKQKSEGKSLIQIWVTQDIIDELKLLKDELKLSRSDAVQYIYSIYKSSNVTLKNDNIITNDILNDQKLNDIDELKNKIAELMIKFESMQEQINKFTSLSLPVEPDATIDLTNMPARDDKDAYKVWLIEVITKIKQNDPDLNNTQIAKRLSQAGIKTIKDGNIKWTNPMVKGLCKNLK